jgi:hypothetical protein
LSLDTARPSELEIDRQPGIPRSIGQGEINHLRDATWVLAIGPANIEAIILPTASCMISVVDHCLISKNLRINFMKPSMMWKAL